jgi:hypothetical protein
MQNMLKGISQWIADKTVGRVDKSLREADTVREIAKTFGINIFPEILGEVEDCSLCKKPNLLLVHPDMICYSCLVDGIQEGCDEIFGAHVPLRIGHLKAFRAIREKELCAQASTQ